MKAVRFHEFGGSDVLRLEEIDDPLPGPGEVTIRIRASALNHLDVDVREGVSRFPIGLPHTLGIEIAGDVEEVGPGVEGWTPGDRVNPFIMATCGECRFCRTGRLGHNNHQYPADQLHGQRGAHARQSTGRNYRNVQPGIHDW